MQGKKNAAGFVLIHLTSETKGESKLSHVSNTSTDKMEGKRGGEEAEV